MALTAIEEVYREAADLIGEVSIDENSDKSVKPYSTCAYHYDNARKEIIRGYAWNEATELVAALEDTTKPAHTWSFRFQVPSDYLKPTHTSKPREDWRVLGKYIYTNYKVTAPSYTVGTTYYAGRYLSYNSVTYRINTGFTATAWTTDSAYCTSLNGDLGYLELEYIKDLSTPSDWSSNLREAIVLNLASKIAIPITGDRELRQSLREELHRLVLPNAHVIDAMQGKPKQLFYSDITKARGE